MAGQGDAGADRRHGAEGVLAGRSGALPCGREEQPAGLFARRHRQRGESETLARLPQEVR